MLTNGLIVVMKIDMSLATSHPSCGDAQLIMALMTGGACFDGDIYGRFDRDFTEYQG